MNDPTGAGSIRGPCGDEMEFYLYVRNGVIEDVKYYTNGCANTRACGTAVARRVKGRSISDALLINAGELSQSGECEPEEGGVDRLQERPDPARGGADPDRIGVAAPQLVGAPLGDAVHLVEAEHGRCGPFLAKGPG